MDININLYNNFISGDEKSFETLVSIFRKPLILFINTFLNDFFASEDIAEDTFVALYLSKKPFVENAKFKTYLFKIARNKSINYIKKMRRNKIINIDNCNNLTCNYETAKSLIVEEDKHELLQAINKLNECYRNVIFLFYYQNFETDEIAKILNKSKKQIFNIHFRAKQQLKELLK